MTELDITTNNIGKSLMKIKDNGANLSLDNKEKLQIKSYINDYIDFNEGVIEEVEENTEDITVDESLIPINPIRTKLFDLYDQEYDNYYEQKIRTKIEVISIVDDFIEASYTNNIEKQKVKTLKRQ